MGPCISRECDKSPSPSYREGKSKSLWARVHVWHTAQEVMLFGSLTPLLGQRGKCFNTLQQHRALRVLCWWAALSKPHLHWEHQAGGEVLQTEESALQCWIDNPLAQWPSNPEDQIPFCDCAEGNCLRQPKQQPSREKQSQCYKRSSKALAKLNKQ